MKNLPKVFDCAVCGREVKNESMVIYHDSELLECYTVCEPCIQSQPESKILAKLLAYESIDCGLPNHLPQILEYALDQVVTSDIEILDGLTKEQQLQIINKLIERM